MPEDQNSATLEDNTAVEAILIVEDDEGIGSFLVEAIKQETPHQPLLASDSYQALEFVHDLKPSLLILDYWLPRINGLALYDQLHATKELKDVPALMISANCPWQEVKKRKITCMQKPIGLDELLQTVETLLA